MDKTIKEFFFSKFATLLLIFIIIFYKLNLVIFSSIFILLLFYEKLVQKRFLIQIILLHLYTVIYIQLYYHWILVLLCFIL